MTRDELIQHLAQLIVGLQVPLSLGVPLGAADDSLRMILRDQGFGWKHAQQIEDYLKKVLNS